MLFRSGLSKIIYVPAGSSSDDWLTVPEDCSNLNGTNDKYSGTSNEGPSLWRRT